METLNPLSLFLPVGILEYFEIVKTLDDSSRAAIHLWLDEKSIPPTKAGYKYISKGFTQESTVQYFPIRGKALYLHLRKRK